jgi:two-component sensor histidine kinase/putative methionine-R-sulfoxide reductase with GAF domain
MEAESVGQWTESASVLAEIGRIISSSLNIDELYDQLGEAISKLIPFDRIHLGLVDYENSATSPVWLIGADVPDRRVGDKVPLEGALAGEVVRTREPVMLTAETEADLEQLYPHLMVSFDAGFRSFMAVPLIDHNVVIGVLQIRSMEQRKYSTRHLELAERIARQISGAVATSQLYAEHKRMADETSVMARIGRIISSSLNIEEVYEFLGEEIRELVPFDRLSLTTVNLEKNELSPAWIIGTVIPGRHVSDTIPLAGSVIEEVCRSKSPLLLDDEICPDLGERFPLLLPSLKVGLKSFLSVPLIYRDTVIGVLQFRSKDRTAFTRRHVDLAERVSNQIAGAVANSQLYAAHKRLSEENSVIAEIGRIVGSSLDISEVYEGVYQEMRKLVHFDRIGINLVDLEQGSLVCAYISGMDVPGRETGYIFPITDATSGAAFIEMSSQVCNPLSESDLTGPFEDLRPHFRVGLRSFLSVPLVSSGRNIGVMRLSSTKSDAYPGEIVEAVERVASHITPALENARLYEGQKNAEEQVRESLREKEILLQEINHRVKNNLQIISSLLNLQSRDISDERVLRSFQTGQDRIGAMAMVHEKLYQSDDLARIDFEEYLRSLSSSLMSSYGLTSRNIDLEINAENVLLGVDTAIPCGVIVNELVSNSLKHAFPEDRDGKIAVSFHEDDGQYKMVFMDDGVGMPGQLDLSCPSTLGLTIVNALIGQLKGTMELDTGGGCKISITFPVKTPLYAHRPPRSSDGHQIKAQTTP